jgi:hypothetical protein
MCRAWKELLKPTPFLLFSNLPSGTELNAWEEILLPARDQLYKPEVARGRKAVARLRKMDANAPACARAHAHGLASKARRLSHVTD